MTDKIREAVKVLIENEKKCKEYDCDHHEFMSMYDDEGFPTFNFETPCPTCNKWLGEIESDPNDIDPTTKMSQQPHGVCTLYCNLCSGYVKPMEWEGNKECPNHQRTFSDEEGTHLLFDEFNQDGEEW